MKNTYLLRKETIGISEDLSLWVPKEGRLRCLWPERIHNLGNDVTVSGANKPSTSTDVPKHCPLSCLGSLQAVHTLPATRKPDIGSRCCLEIPNSAYVYLTTQAHSSTWARKQACAMHNTQTSCPHHECLGHAADVPANSEGLSGSCSWPHNCHMQPQAQRGFLLVAQAP